MCIIVGLEFLHYNSNPKLAVALLKSSKQLRSSIGGVMSGRAAIRGQEAAEKAHTLILTMLAKENRPFSCIQLWEDSKKVVSRAVIQSTLSRLVAEGKLVTKTIGKTSLIYYPPQSQNSFSSEELYEQRHDVLPRLEAECRQMSADANRVELRSRELLAQPTNSELESSVQAAANPEATARLTVLRSREFVQPEQLAVAKREHIRHLGRWRQLRHAVEAAIDVLQEKCADSVDVRHLAGILDDAEAQRIVGVAQQRET